jgi:tetratricopeptide (TPR) repeat protein
MFARLDRFWSPLRHLIGRRPITTLVVGVLVVGLTGWLTTLLWADYQFRAALRACKEDRLPDARSHLQSCLLIKPNNFEAHLLAARAYRMGNQFSKASAQLDECRRIKGDTTEQIQLEWHLLRAQAGELKELEPGLKRCVDENVADTVWILEGLAHCHMGQLSFSVAHQILDQWLKREPDNIRALNWRSFVRERLEYVEGAHEDCVRILELNPGNAEIRLRLVGYLLQGLKFEEAEKHLEILLKERGQDPEVLFFWGQRQAFKGEMEEARKTFDALIAKNPKDGRALYQRAKLDLQEGKPEEAEDLIRRSLAVDRGNIEARYSLYSALERIPKKKHLAKQALADFQKAQNEAKRVKQLLQRLETSPGDARLMVEAGEAFLRSDNGDMGRLFLLRSLGIDPRNKKAHELLIEYYDRNDMKDKADSHRRQLEKLSP